MLVFLSVAPFSRITCTLLSKQNAGTVTSDWIRTVPFENLWRVSLPVSVGMVMPPAMIVSPAPLNTKSLFVQLFGSPYTPIGPLNRRQFLAEGAIRIAVFVAMLTATLNTCVATDGESAATAPAAMPPMPMFNGFPSMWPVPAPTVNSTPFSRWSAGRSFSAYLPLRNSLSLESKMFDGGTTLV